MKIKKLVPAMAVSILAACATAPQSPPQLHSLGENHGERISDNTFQVTEVVTANYTMVELLARMTRLGDKYCKGKLPKVDGLGKGVHYDYLDAPNLQIEVVKVICPD